MSETSTLILDIIARDKASREIAKAGLALAAVTAGIVKFGRDSVKAYSESEDAVNKLTFAYNKFPKAADVTLQSMDDLSKTLQKTTIYSDEQTKSAEAMLLQFNLTGKQVEQLIPLIQDYASATNQDLTSATESVGKAFEGNARALKQVGINFHATGNTAQDFATIMADLNEKVGGFATSQGKTAAGQAAILANTFNDLQEQVGSLLVPALTDLVKILTPMVETFNKLPGPVKDLDIILAAVGVTALVVVPKIVALRANLVELATAGVGAGAGLEATAAGATVAGNASLGASVKIGSLAKAAGVVGLVVTGLGFATDKFNEAVGNTSKSGDDAVNVVKQIGASGKITADELKAAGAPATEFAGIMHDIFDRSALQNVTAFTNQLDSLGGVLPWGEDNVKAGQRFFATVDQGLSQLASTDAPAAAQAFNTLAVAASAQGVSVYRLKSLLPEYTAVLGTTTAAEDAAAGATDTATQSLIDKYKALESVTLASYDARDADLAATKAVKDLNKQHKETTTAVDETMRKILEAADKEAAAQKNPTMAAHAFANELFEQEKRAKPGSKLQLALDAYIRKMGLIPPDVTTDLHVRAASVTEIPVYGNVGGVRTVIGVHPRSGGTVLFGEGGIVTRPTMGIVGEAGPEAVVPLSGPGKASLGANYYVTVNVSSLVPTNGAELGKQLIGYLRQGERLTGAGWRAA